ncbi:hypothetical protein J0J30_23485, partial [Vibrio vulnificus]|nr:hypothetical protein [Vibrio vulnificus]
MLLLPYFSTCLLLTNPLTIHNNEMQVTTSYMKMISSYVMQDDQLFPALTVFETFMFAAEVRLPPSISRAEKRKRVYELLDQ